jgi:hypothetical protein
MLATFLQLPADALCVLSPSAPPAATPPERPAGRPPRPTTRRAPQAKGDPRFRAALAAAQAAFAADAGAGAGEDNGSAAATWEGLEDEEYVLDEADGPDGLEDDGEAYGMSHADEDDDRERVLLVGMALKSAQQRAAAAAHRRLRDAGGGGWYAAGGGDAGGDGDGEGVWRDAYNYTVEESLAELGRLAETAGLKVGGGDAPAGGKLRGSC